jgi:hypothetical protein
MSFVGNRCIKTIPCIFLIVKSQDLSAKRGGIQFFKIQYGVASGEEARSKRVAGGFF